MAMPQKNCVPKNIQKTCWFLGKHLSQKLQTPGNLFPEVKSYRPGFMTCFLQEVEILKYVVLKTNKTHPEPKPKTKKNIREN